MFAAADTYLTLCGNKEIPVAVWRQVGKLYLVDRGESLGTIAAEMGATVAAVRDVGP